MQIPLTTFVTHPDVKFIMIVDDAKKVEQYSKIFIKQFQYKPNTELYDMYIIEFIYDWIFTIYESSFLLKSRTKK